MKLKYRAWRKATELMDEVVTIDLYNEEIGLLYANPITQCEDIQRYDFDEIELMRSTGLEDKNGTEIFEGDIVRWKDREPIHYEIVYEDVFVIYWSDEFLTWRGKNKDSNVIDLYDLYDTSDNRELEMIGNIYENKELI